MSEELSQAKIIGGLGALLTLIGGFIPTIAPVLLIVGFIMIFISVRKISDITKDESIASNYLLSFVIIIITIVVVFAMLLYTFQSVGGLSYFTAFEDMDTTDPAAVWDHLAPLIGKCLLTLVVGWILVVISSLFLKKSYDAIAKKTKVDLFRTTGLVYFIGALTTIILIGFLILLIAKILELIAFFSLPDDIGKPAAAEIEQ